MMYMIASLLFHMASAMSLRAEKTGGDILWSGSKISLLTMETRATNQLRLLNNPPKNYYVENVGAGVKIRKGSWHNVMSGFNAFQRLLSNACGHASLSTDA